MVDVVPPLRSDPLVDEDGNVTLRYAEYFERTAESTTTNEENIDLSESINLGVAAQAGQKSDIKDIQALSGINESAAALSRHGKDLDDLRLLTTVNQNSAAISLLLKRLKELELLAGLPVIGEPTEMTDYFVEVAKGNIFGSSIVNIAATNPQVGTTEEEVWDAGGVLTYATANETWEINSANANDTAGGTGAQEVTITYMDEDYIEQPPVVLATNGGTVSLVVSDSFRMVDGKVTAVGSGGENEGDIVLRVASAGATRGQINATENQTQDSHFTTPAGKTAYIVGFYNEINKNEDIKLTFRRTDGDNGIFRTILTSSLYQDQFGWALKAPADALIAKTDFKVLCVSTNANAIATVIVQILLVDD